MEVEVPKKLRVALCISGFVHQFEEGSRFLIPNLVEHLQPDIFIHSWDIIGKRTIGSIESDRISEEIQTEIEKIYKPVKAIYEPFRTFDGSVYQDRMHRTCSPPNGLSMFYKIKACNALKADYEREHGFTYDWVIRCRFDIRLETVLTPKDLDDWQGSLVVPSAWNWFGVNDQFACASSKQMDVYAGLYDVIRQYWEDGCTFHPETLLQYHLNDSEVPYRRVDLNYSLGSSPKVLSQVQKPQDDGSLQEYEVVIRVIPETAVSGRSPKWIAWTLLLSALNLQQHPSHFERFIFLCPRLGDDKERGVGDEFKRLWFASRLFIFKRYKLQFDRGEALPARIDQIRNYCTQQETSLRFYQGSVPKGLLKGIVRHVIFLLGKGRKGSNAKYKV